VKPLRIDPEAEAELLEVARWYAARGGPELQRRLLDDTAAVLDSVRRWPGRFAALNRPKLDPPLRRARVRRFPYALVFVDLPSEIHVLAFAHLRRRPLYWVSRLRP
jgi:plasmid stabilization system protein ParE